MYIGLDNTIMFETTAIHRNSIEHSKSIDTRDENGQETDMSKIFSYGAITLMLYFIYILFQHI